MTQNFFPTAAPEEEGIDSQYLINFLEVLENDDLPIHSAILMRHGNVIMETYYKPYTRDSLHRMFSVTKSFVSIAIGLLEAEGKLSLDDKIVSFFPEKQPVNGPFEYTAMMTIRDMLRMASCHDKTTFKVMKSDDWVKTFFQVEPNHVPGTSFAYDTSSTHTLAALVEKLSGMELLDYLRDKFLNELDFSKEAYCMKDPVGVSMGGSGMMATPYDMLKVMYVISNDGRYNGKQLLPSSYLKQASSNQITNYAKSASIEEMQGYGYQFWRTRNNGVAFYGMGGQIVLWMPEKDLILVTTADAQGRNGGVQLIYDAFLTEVYNKIDANVNNSINPARTNSPDYITNEEKATKFMDFCNTREIMHLQGSETSSICDRINNKIYALDNNPMGFESIQLILDNERACGELRYTHTSGTHTLKFGIGNNIIQQFPDYDYRCATSGCWKTDDTFLIKSHLIDECIGNIYIQLVFKDNYITVLFKKVEETMFNEFNGTVSGRLV